MINTSIVYYEELGRAAAEQFINDMFQTGRFAGIFIFRKTFDEDVYQYWINTAIVPNNFFEFKIQFLRNYVAFPTPDNYWAYYVQCLARNELANTHNLKLIDYNTGSRSIPPHIKFKNYLNFLRYMFKGKQKQAARVHYLKDLRALPDSARNLEGGVKTFL